MENRDGVSSDEVDLSKVYGLKDLEKFHETLSLYEELFQKLKIVGQGVSGNVTDGFEHAPRRE